MTGESLGSTAIARKDFLRGLMTSATPVMVPPVPTAEIKISIFLFILLELLMIAFMGTMDNVIILL